jgi:spoIIIJ-associated protein
MASETEKSAPTIENALKAAALELNANVEDLEYEVLVQPEKKLFGRGQEATIRAWLKEDLEDTNETAEGFAEETGNSIENDGKSEKDEDFIEEDINLDEIADNNIAVLKELLPFLGVENFTIDEYEGEEGGIILDIVGEDLAVLIGRHGKTLDALQFIVSAISSKRNGFRYPVVIDVEGYKNRRRNKIEEIAFRAVEKAEKQNRDVKLRPMTAYERRIVHVCLKEHKGIETVSEGKQPDRYIIVKLVR